ncbi:xanthine dehydrogenase family protein subunit M [Maricurvus nonylphenolicus]|uniref:FAD binding domain-containing protein n=1 Tax=Maricurvus nonylphenolicus TaxID=1008307 RepID=UPI0036F26639
MKPAAFDYQAPSTLDEAISLLTASDDAKVIAGGQSLMPMLNFRLLAPELLVDIAGIEELRGIEPGKSRGLSVGALTRHHEMETSELVKERFPVISEAMKFVAHLAIRNRGTIGGSISHADPAAELPMMAMLLDAQLTVAGPSGKRTVAAEDFFLGALTTDLEENEILARIDFPGLPKNTHFVFDEFAQRAGDFALCAVAMTLSMGGNFLTGGKKISEARIALMGVDETPIRIKEAEALLVGNKTIDEGLLEQVATIVRDTVQPNADLHASSEYRQYLAYTMSKRSLKKLWAQACGQDEE